MPGDAIAIDQRDEILRAIAAQRRFGEMGVGGQIAVGRGVDVGEIAAATAGNEDLLAHLIGMIDQQHAPAPLARYRRAHHPRRACAQDDRVPISHYRPRLRRTSASSSAERKRDRSALPISEQDVGGDADGSRIRALRDPVIGRIEAVADHHPVEQVMRGDADRAVADDRDRHGMAKGDLVDLFLDGAGIGIDQNLHGGAISRRTWGDNGRRANFEGRYSPPSPRDDPVLHGTG